MTVENLQDLKIMVLREGLKLGVNPSTISFLLEKLTYYEGCEGHEGHVPRLERSLLKFSEEVKWWRAQDVFAAIQYRKYEKTNSMEGPWNCCFCQAKPFTTDNDLVLHLMKEHPFKQNVSQALLEQEETGPFQCPYCNVTPFDDREQLDAHIKSKHPKGSEAIFAKQTYFCPYCNEGAFSLTELKGHVKAEHEEKYDALFKSGRRVGT